MGCIGGVISLLSRGLLIGSLVPVTWLEVIPRLVKRILGLIVWDSSSGPYGLDHLLGFGMLYGFGFVLVVILREWGHNDCVQDTRGEAVQKEAYCFFTSDGVAGAADEFFEVSNVLINFWEAHFALV
jgi:hypothetical protein